MSEDATFQIEEWLVGYSIYDSNLREQAVRENQLIARGLALQTMGVIPMHNDLEWIDAAVQSVPMESLRSKGTDEG